MLCKKLLTSLACLCSNLLEIFDRMRVYPFIRIVAIVLAIAIFSACESIDNTRIPRVNVNLVFWTQADWVTYGVSGAGQSKRFIRQDKEPSNYPYTAQTYTGYGGILLCTDYMGAPVAYDLSCPVEAKYDVRVAVNADGEAECPKCRSRYDIFSLKGYPVYGRAAEQGYGLQRYNVGPGRGGEYMVVN